jgi:hypothetical protein
MVTTTSPVAGVVNEPVPRAIIVRPVCRSPFAVSNSAPGLRKIRRSSVRAWHRALSVEGGHIDRIHAPAPGAGPRCLAPDVSCRDG